MWVTCKPHFGSIFTGAIYIHRFRVGKRKLARVHRELKKVAGKKIWEFTMRNYIGSDTVHHSLNSKKKILKCTKIIAVYTW